MNIDEILKKISSGEFLTHDESTSLANYIAEDNFDPVKVGAALAMMAVRKEKADEILGFIDAYSRKMLPFPHVQDGIDMAGTGGGRIKIGNLSTAASFVLASLGYKVVKHGNRSFTHKQGSADALENSGINIRLQPDQAYSVLQRTGMVFLFAQLYHPAIGRVSQIRKTLGFRTIFNKIGVFLNPARVGYHVMGVPELESLGLMGEVARNLDNRTFLLVHSEAGADELLYGVRNKAYFVSGGKIENISIHMGDAYFRNNVEDYNIERVLRGESHNIILKSVALNAAAALYIKNEVNSIEQGMNEAESAIINGDAYRKFIEYRSVANNA